MKFVSILLLSFFYPLSFLFSSRNRSRTGYLQLMRLELVIRSTLPQLEHGDLNPEPDVYKTPTLPLSYAPLSVLMSPQCAAHFPSTPRTRYKVTFALNLHTGDRTTNPRSGCDKDSVGIPKRTDTFLSTLRSGRRRAGVPRTPCAPNQGGYQLPYTCILFIVRPTGLEPAT